MPTGVPLTQEQITFVRKHFPHMRNQDLMDATGVSRSSLWNIQKRYHLRKSGETAHALAVKAGKASAKARGGKVLGITPDVARKRVESLQRTRREERARVLFGLPQKTRLKVKVQPKQKCSQRSYLKKLGYILDERNCVAYYDENTTRAVRMERHWRKGIRNYYKFMPYEQGEHQPERGE